MKNPQYEGSTQVGPSQGYSVLEGSAPENLAMKGESVVEKSIGSIRINPAERHQTMEGFSTSGCWWAQDVGTWDDSAKEQVADWLFDREKGIGLTQYRFNVGGGDLNESPDQWRRVETFETKPGQYDWNRDAGSVAMLRLAVSHGVQDVLFFANTPPGRMLKNGRTTGGEKGDANLKPGMEDDFARYLVDIALHFRSEGIPVKYISPINEPQWDWQLSKGQEGCHYTPEGVVAVGRALVEELNVRGEGMMASLADSGKMWDPAYTLGLYKTLSQDLAFAGKLPHFAVHAYWSSEMNKKMLAGELKKLGNPLPLWQSEWCQMKSGRDFDMDPAMVLARCVHEDLTILDCTAWQNWIAVTCYDYKDGLIHVDPSVKKATDMKRLWALGNWSRFVRPGYVRVAAESPSSGLLVSAWQSVNGEETVIVAVNEGRKAITASLPSTGNSNGTEGNKVNFKAWETSDAKSLECVFDGVGSMYRFPARSITTILI